MVSEKEILEKIRFKMIWIQAMNDSGWQRLPNGGFMQRIGQKRAYIPQETAVWYQEQGSIPAVPGSVTI